MAVFPLACKEMVTIIEKLLIWMVLFHFKFNQLLSPLVLSNGNLMVSNNIIAFFL